ncbi:MAG: hypothetical protein JWR00_1726 [Rubritepida sp.]|nr:hypothetical protein [Rubritepida sp.]
MIGRSSARRQALLATGLTLAFMLLVALGVSDQGWSFAAAALVIASLALGGLHLVFPHGLLFALGLANGLAIYVCLFVVIARASFPDAAEWSRSVAFLLPVLSFVLACVARRRALTAAASSEMGADLKHLPRFARWMIPTALVGAISLSLPVNRFAPEWQTFLLLVAMGAIAAITAASVGPIVRLLVDISVIMRQVGHRVMVLAVPIATYVSLFALLAVAFGCLYRTADGFSRTPIFLLMGQPGRLSFSDALHFSIVTLSTVGYGDIQPADDGIRLLAAVQMILGQLLLLFGFAEIMRSHAGEQRK